MLVCIGTFTSVQLPSPYFSILYTTLHVVQYIYFLPLLVDDTLDTSVDHCNSDRDFEGELSGR